MDKAVDNKEKQAARTALLTDKKAAEKAYVASYTVINNRSRNTETAFKKSITIGQIKADDWCSRESYYVRSWHHFLGRKKVVPTS